MTSSIYSNRNQSHLRKKVSRNASKATSDTDIYIGRRLRLWRRTMNANANALAAAVGISYQQFQKYEKGMSRISASRLFAISKALDVPIALFFEDEEAEYNIFVTAESERVHETRKDMFAQLSNGGSANFLKYYLGITRPSVREALLNLMRAITSNREAAT